MQKRAVRLKSLLHRRGKQKWKKNGFVKANTVIDSLRVGEVEIVLAYNPKDVSPYVTWKAYAHSGFQDFNFGNYFSNKQAARADMIARAREAARDLPPGHRDKEKFSRHRKKPDRER